MANIDNDFFSQFISEVDSNDFDLNFEQMSYQGFDPVTIRKEIIKKKWKKQELFQIIIYFLLRGTNISSKALGRSTKECIDLIGNLKNKGLKEKPVAANDITINRVISSMPEIVAKILHDNFDRCRVIGRDDVPSLPFYLKFSSGASLCINETELNDWISWAVIQDSVINEKKKPDPSRVQNFAVIQYNNQFFSTTQRNIIRAKIMSSSKGSEEKSEE
jgi:hypothetical protein